jgi:Putative Actinobacterial Holin-X, holin superfamily III
LSEPAVSARFFDHRGTAQQTPLREQLVCLARDLRASLAARVEVARTELRASTHELIGGAVALAAAALFAIGAWTTVCALLATGLVALGLGWLPALLAVAVFNALLALVALLSARRHLGQVGLKHTYNAFLGRPHRDPEQQLADQVRPSALHATPDIATTTPAQGVHHGAS